MLKYVMLIGIAYFFWWMLRRQWRHKQMAWRGEPVPVDKGGWRPITLLSIALVVIYGGYMLWHVFSQVQSGGG
jgi:hypothetical protein